MADDLVNLKGGWQLACGVYFAVCDFDGNDSSRWSVCFFECVSGPLGLGRDE